LIAPPPFGRLICGISMALDLVAATSPPVGSAGIAAGDFFCSLSLLWEGCMVQSVDRPIIIYENGFIRPRPGGHCTDQDFQVLGGGVVELEGVFITTVIITTSLAGED
jgi:hypothetical protein